MLEIRNVTKIYGSGKTAFKALDDVSIRFGSKGMVVILGKSGSGKSTLLNIVGGLDKPTSGDVVINGQSTRSFSRADYDAYRNTYVGIVFQEFNLIDEITVFDNINMTLKLQEKSADVNTVDEALTMVGLANMGYRKPGELSGGQRQRVALARALLKKPEIILADEPTGALDSSTSEEVFESLKKISETKLVVVVTHNRELAHTYGDRIIELVDGKPVSDRTRRFDASVSVKAISPAVLQIAAGGRVTKSDLLERIDEKQVSYIGISHDKDRIALAYPETFDSFYVSSDSAEYQPTRDEQIPVDTKPFRLGKGRLPVKEAVKMARASIKGRKKRYRLLTFLTVMCFTFVCLSFIVSSLSTSSLVAKTAFEADGQQMVVASKIPQFSYQRDKLLDSDLRQAESAGLGKIGRIFMLQNASPVYASEKSNGSMPYYPSYRQEFEMRGFSGVIEDARPSDFGIKLTSGSENPETLNDVVISDMSAYELLHSGYVGYDAAGVYGLHYPVAEAELIGARFLMDETNQYYRIVGVYRTDYMDYRSTVTASPMDTNAGKKRDTLASNKRFLYSRFFAREGFGRAYISDSAQGAGAYLLGFRRGHYGEGETFYNFSASVLSETMAYSPDMFLSGTRDGRISKLLWTREGGDEPLPPDSLAPNEFIVSVYVVAAALNMQITDEQHEREILETERFRDFVNGTFSLDIQTGSTVLKKITDAKIVGVISAKSPFLPDALVSPQFRESLLDSVVSYDLVCFGRGGTRSSLQKKLSILTKSGFSVGAAKASDTAMHELSEILDTMSTVFLYLSLGFLLFALLIILNFISSSVRFRTKEIAVYRVVGAKSMDVAKIFLAEGAFITVRTTILATALTFLITLMLNAILSSVISFMGMGFTLLSFNWLVHPLLILLTTALFVFVSSLVPILHITRKKPIDAVKMI